MKTIAQWHEELKFEAGDYIKGDLPDAWLVRRMYGEYVQDELYLEHCRRCITIEYALWDAISIGDYGVQKVRAAYPVVYRYLGFATVSSARYTSREDFESREDNSKYTFVRMLDNVDELVQWQPVDAGR